VKLASNEKALNVPLDAELRTRVKKEAKANGLQLREAVADALVLWLQTVEYMNQRDAQRAEERSARPQELLET